MKWIAFYSRSGSEIVALANYLGRWPDVICSNKAPEDIRKEFKENSKVLLIPKNPNKDNFIQLGESILTYLNVNPRYTIVTLHGFLRIVPVEFINMFPRIYNGHPGLIDPVLTKDPNFLKGKDPQKKAWEAKLETSGSVIHKVTPVVDDGAIVLSCYTPIKDKTLDEVYTVLADSSLSLWKTFLGVKMYDHHQ